MGSVFFNVLDAEYRYMPTEKIQEQSFLWRLNNHEMGNPMHSLRETRIPNSITAWQINRARSINSKLCIIPNLGLLLIELASMT